jgi:hypothetical protein
MNYLDIDKLNMEKGKLQSNIEQIVTTYGSEFECVSETLGEKKSIPVKLYQEHVVSVGIKYWTLIYNIPFRTFSMFPLKINFIDPEAKKLTSNVYIQNIHATQDLTGTQIVKFTLRLLKALGCVQAYLHDGATIECGSNRLTYDLTYYKLLEKNKSFYMGLGFDHDISVTTDYPASFKSKSQLKKFMKKIIKACKKVKVSTLISYYTKLLGICTQIISNGSLSSKLIIRCARTFNIIEPIETKNIWICKPNSMELIQECKEMLEILKQSDHKYIADMLVDYFKSDRSCYLLEPFEKYVLESNIYEIEYNNIILSREYLGCFKILRYFRHNSNYSYQFD